MTAGVTLTCQMPASAIASVPLDDRSPTAIWSELAGAPAFQAAIEHAIRVSAVGKAPNEFRNELVDRDLPLGFGELAVRIAKGDTNAAYRLARAIETLGSGRDSLDDVFNAISLLEGDGDESRVPVIGFRLHPSFFESRSDHRRDICRLIAGLARACDVRLVGSGIDHRDLARKHREQLPGVSEHCKTSSPELSPEAAAETAWDELDPSSREVSILRDLQRQPSETLSRHALRSDSTVSRSRISQCVSKLIELGVVVTFDGHGDQYIELVEAGRLYLDTLDREIGRQRRLDESVSESGKSSIYCRVSTERDGGGEGIPTTVPTGPADRRRHGSAVNVAYMPRWQEAAVAGCATEGAISLVDHPVEPSDELRQPYLSYDGDNRLVVGAEYTNPMQYAVCVARALTDRSVFAEVLTPERVDGDLGYLGGLATDDPRILRDARCLGWLKDRNANAEAYAEVLMAAEDELLDMTRRWHTGNYDCTAEAYRGKITRFAHGIMGTVAHLCDLADVDLVREVRLPEFTRRFDGERRKALSKTLVHSAQVASRHGHFAAYRQLFEERDEKRAAAMSPTIPADNLSGDMIGSYVVVGKNASGLFEDLRNEIRGTVKDETGEDLRLHEDAPEFDVPISITTDIGRPAVALTARDCLASKNLSATREAIALFDGLAGSPYDVARAITQGLQAEDCPRDIRLDEVRLCLSKLPADRLFPTMQPTIQKLTKALLTVESPLTKSELADRADVSARSVRTHLPRLEALGLADVSGAGIRFALPFTTSDERGKDIIPGLATERGPRPIDLAYELAEAISGDAVHDFETPVGAAFFVDGWAEALSRLPLYECWIGLIERLSHQGIDAETTVVRFGKQSDQMEIQEVAA